MTDFQVEEVRACPSAIVLLTQAVRFFIGWRLRIKKPIKRAMIPVERMHGSRRRPTPLPVRVARLESTADENQFMITSIRRELTRLDAKLDARRASQRINTAAGATVGLFLVGAVVVAFLVFRPF